jgi:hypothetical protein
MEDNTMSMSVLIKQAGVPNENGIIFTKECLQKIAETEPPILGEVGKGITNYEMSPDLTKVSHVFSDLVLNEQGDLYAVPTLLDTPIGRIIGNLQGIALNFGLNCIAKVDENGVVSPDGLELISISVCHANST